MVIFRKLTRIGIAAVTLATSPLFAEAPDRSDIVQARTHADLDQLVEAVRLFYGPADWKAAEYGWSLSQIQKQADAKIDNNKKLDIHGGREILREFLTSLNDYHVNVYFYSTESSYLPFRIRGAEGRWFVTVADRQEALYSETPLNYGDEILEFDQSPIAQAVDQHAKKVGGGNAATNQRIAEETLTARMGYRGEKCPTGTARLLVQDANGVQRIVHAKWRHQREAFPITPAHLKSFDACEQTLLWPSHPQKNVEETITAQLQSLTHYPLPNRAEALQINTETLPSPYDIGHHSGCLPLLGPVLWKDPDSAPFSAYIFSSPEGYAIGYVRIPAYYYDGPDSNGELTGEEFAADYFATLMAFMNKSTNLLIVDQTSNPGGYALYSYALLSCLSSRPLKAPMDKIRLNQQQIIEATMAENFFNSFSANDWDLDLISLQGYPVSLDTIRSIQGYFQTLIEDWHQQKIISRYLPLLNIAKIKPNPKGHYSRPILFLIDEQDFSCADLVPAILQDNKRALLMGTTTGGAGGTVSSHSLNSHLGMAVVSLTNSLLRRTNGEILEDRGVTPDIPYELTVRDLQEGCNDFRNAIIYVVDEMLRQ